MTNEASAMNSSTAVTQTINFPSLESMLTSWIPVPRIKLMQANSQDVLLKDGKTEARKGSLYYQDFQSQEAELKIALAIV